MGQVKGGVIDFFLRSLTPLFHLLSAREIIPTHAPLANKADTIGQNLFYFILRDHLRHFAGTEGR